MQTKSMPQPDEALQILLEGNNRFVSGDNHYPNHSPERRRAVAGGQSPIAAILSCSDSRVPPETIFDQGIGDLFVIRVAGNIIGVHSLGSIEYAVMHLKTPLVMVMAHSCCGAVGAVANKVPLDGHMASFVPAVQAAIENCNDEAGDLVDNAARIVARMVATQIATSEPIIADYVKAGRVKVVTAYYDLVSGEVTLL